MAKGRIKCEQCGAKNDLQDLCRICGRMLPGAEKRRREGTGGVAFDETVAAEREAWADYSQGRMSASSRSRRPDELPDAPPATWGGASALAGASPAPEPRKPPEPAAPADVPRAHPSKVRGGLGPMVVLVLLAVAAVAVAAFAYLR